MHRDMFDSMKGIGMNTAAVVFLLALEFGRTVIPFSIDGAFMSMAILAVLALPYFFAWTRTDLSFAQWMLVRSGIVVLGLVSGAILASGVGTVVPATVKFVPMLALIAAVAISFTVNANGFLRLQLAK